jgi:acyl carrier protein
MTKQSILKELTPIFEELFDENNLVLTEKTTADDIEDWDSLTHMHLVVLIEEHYKIKFTANEIGDFNDVGDMVKAILAKKK